jgi:hypothetical protein
MFAIQLVASVHRQWFVPVVFPYSARLVPCLQIGESVSSNGRGVDEDDGAAVGVDLARGKLEQVERAFDIHVMSGHRREFGSRRQQRRQVKNEIDLEFRQDPLQQVGVEDRPRKLALHERCNLRVQRVDVERHDAAVLLLGEIGYQGVADFAIRAGYQNNRFSHVRGVGL